MAHVRARPNRPCPGAAGGQDLPVFVLTGPTGAGKTDWALGLAETAPVEIVSVDSALVYRGLDIGTAKPARELRARVPHHLIDICEPTESYSAGRFVADALGSIRDIHARRRVPLLVGGPCSTCAHSCTGWRCCRRPTRCCARSWTPGPPGTGGRRCTRNYPAWTRRRPRVSRPPTANGSSVRWKSVT